jgi:molybdate transport system substrate-binding protein
MRIPFTLSLWLAASLSWGASPLIVGAASDLAPLETALRNGFRKQAGMDARFVFGSSGMLARQIEHGAPYDVYLSANESYVDGLDRKGLLVDGTRAVYAVGRLGLWSRNGGFRNPSDLEKAGRIAIPNPEHAPYGAAAEELLRTEGLWDRLKPKLVLGENVRQAYEYARTGNADAVITSWTLLFDKGGILLPAKHRPIRQAGAVLKGSKQLAAARKWMQFLKSREGQSILLAGGLEAAQ